MLNHDWSKPINLPLPSEIALPIVILWIFLSALVNLAFAFAVAIDSGMLPHGRRTTFVGRFMWFIATLFGGVFVAAVYWVIHHSILCPWVFFSVKRDLDIETRSQDDDDD